MTGNTEQEQAELSPERHQQGPHKGRRDARQLSTIAQSNLAQARAAPPSLSANTMAKGPAALRPPSQGMSPTD